MIAPPRGFTPPHNTPESATRWAEAVPAEALAATARLGVIGRGGDAREGDTERLFPAVPGYHLTRELGRGGMGVVFEAEDVALHRVVALKLMCDEVDGNAQVIERMRVEAEAVARLHHPNVVQIYGVIEYRRRPVLVLELVQGGSLADRLKAGALPARVAVGVLRAVAGAIQHAHDRGVIHRDLKPANILLDHAGCQVGGGADLPFVPKVTDFGVAKLLDVDRGSTRSGMMLGTVCYMAPEVIEHAGAVSPAADVYSLGVILFECLTARLPLEEASLLRTIHAVLYDEPPPLAKFLSGPVGPLDAIYRRALAKTPADRYPSVQAFLNDLDAYVAGRAIPARPARPAPPPARPARRWLRPALAAAAATGLAAGVGGYEGYAAAGAAAATAGECYARGDFARAEEEAARGVRKVRGLPGCGAVNERLDLLAAAARRGQGAAGLHRLVERLRYGTDPESGGAADVRGELAACDAAWAVRDRFRAVAGHPLPAGDEGKLSDDLLDLAVISAELKVRVAAGRPEGKADALDRLREAEAVVDPARGLDRVRADYESDRRPAGGPDPAMTDWELYALGRSRLAAGDAAGAVPFLREATKRDPGAFWPNYYEAIAAMRCGRPEEAVSGLSVCLAAAPGRPGLCYYNRALAYESMGKLPSAERDLDRAVEAEPGLAAALYRRGLVRLGLGNLDGAAEDLERVRGLGPVKPELWFHLAVVREGRNDHAAAVEAADEAVRADPANPRSRDLLAALRAGRPLTRPTIPARNSP